MHSVTLPRDLTYTDIVRWCNENISETAYYIHTKAGGVGWTYHVKGRVLVFDDGNHALLFRLSFGC